MRRERGQALIETILLGLLMLVPLLWALTVLADLHRAALASTAAAREAGFDASHASSLAEASVGVESAVQQAYVDYGLEPGRATVSWTASGLRRGAVVEVRVAYPVAMVRAPLLGAVAGPTVWVRGEHFARVDRFGSRP